MENPLYKPMSLDDAGSASGSFNSLAAHRGVTENVYDYLTPTDVASMERTCRSFAVDAERGRRIALAGKLRTLSKKSCPALEAWDRAEAVDEAIAKYVNGTAGSPQRALGAFISEVRHLFGKAEWVEYISSTKIDPMSLKAIIGAAFSEISPDEEHDLFGAIDFGHTSRDFQIFKYILMCNAGPLTFMKHDVLQAMTNMNYDGDGGCRFLRLFFQHSLDIEIMKLALSLNGDFGDEYDDQLKQSALILLNNTILSEGGRRRPALHDSNDPLLDTMMTYHAM